MVNFKFNATMTGINVAYHVNFNKDSPSPMKIEDLLAGELLKEVCIKVTTAFDPGFTVSLGFPADHNEIIPVGDANLEKLGEYKFYPYRISAIAETLNLYFIGVSAQGAGVLFVEKI